MSDSGFFPTSTTSNSPTIQISGSQNQHNVYTIDNRSNSNNVTNSFALNIYPHDSDPDLNDNSDSTSDESIVARFHKNGRSYLTQLQRRELNEVLYGNLDFAGNKHLDLFDAFIFVRSLAYGVPMESTVKHIRCLVEFLETRGTSGTIAEFEREVTNKQVPDLPKDRRPFANSWDILCTSLNFSMFASPSKDNFLDQIGELFPETDQQPIFSLSLVDITKADLFVRPTENIDEHLEFDGEEVKVYTLDAARTFLLMNYRHNKVACTMGISSLGDEILTTIARLVRRDPVYREAEALGIIKFYSDADRHFTIPMALKIPSNKPLKVFAARATALQTAIRSRIPTLGATNPSVKQ